VIDPRTHARLLRLLALEDCWFTRDEHVAMPVIAPDGRLDLPVLHYQRGGFELPQPAVAIAVQDAGQVLGHIVCVPLAGVGINIERRRAAVAIAADLAAALIQTPVEVRTLQA
jgi:hypothetical protein